MFGIELQQEQIDAIEKIKGYLTPGVVLPLALIATFAGFLLFGWIIPEIADYTAFMFAPPGVVDKDPRNVPSKAEPFVMSGSYGRLTSKHVYLIKPVADYEIEARVLHVRRYSDDRNSADLLPFDIGLGWRLMSDAEALGKYFVFHHRNTWGRYLRAELKTDCQKIPMAYLEELRSGKHYSNNHVIPANRAVFETLEDMKAGDIVRLKGHLVNVSRPDSPEWEWKTSDYAREDANKGNRWGDGRTSSHMTTCDTLYVTSAEIVSLKGSMGK